MYPRSPFSRNKDLNETRANGNGGEDVKGDVNTDASLIYLYPIVGLSHLVEVLLSGFVLLKGRFVC